MKNINNHSMKKIKLAIAFAILITPIIAFFALLSMTRDENKSLPKEKAVKKLSIKISKKK